MNWIEEKNYLRGAVNKLEELFDPVRVASFDLDDTLIYRPMKDSEEWKLLDPTADTILANLVDRRYIIVIFTNQSGMSKKDFDIAGWRKNMDQLYLKLVSKMKNPYYFAIYVAKTHDLYRKPNLGMWDKMKSDLKDRFGMAKLRISTKSFFVGDAGGRINASIFKKKIHPKSNKGDFSDVDRKFALNIGIKYLTPEDIFMEDAPEMEYQLKGFDPVKFLKNVSVTQNNYLFQPRKKEMIILVGFPGSGKTEFFKKYIAPYEYVHINQDTCKTKVKCTSLTKSSLEEQKSVVIDNTNSDLLTRASYIKLAVDYGYKHIRAIILDSNIDLAKHLNNVRHIYSGGEIPKINDIVYNIYKKNYREPSKSERFDKIENVEFEFDIAKLDDPLWRKIFTRWSE